MANNGLALNLAALASYEPGRQFIDWMKFTEWRSDSDNTMSGVTTNVAGYSIGATSITLASGGTGSLNTGKVVWFTNPSHKYRVTSGLANVASGGAITIEAMGTTGGGLIEAIPASATAVSQHGYGAYDHSQLEYYGYLNANDFPTAIPPQMSNVATIWSTDGGGADPGVPGAYVAKWSGAATVSIEGDMSDPAASPGRIEFTRAGGNPVYLVISGGLSGGDPLTSINVFRAEHEALLDGGEIFNPDWLAVVKGARQLRFMDWMKTNWSTQSEWADRPLVGDVTYSPRGVPVEIMVALANEIGADPWFNMPHTATDEYVEEFATIVEATLDAPRVAHVEYSNETWNFGFGQYTWLYNIAQAEWGDGNLGIQYSAKKSAEFAQIWNDVFGYTPVSKGNPRLYHVIGVQTGYQDAGEIQIAAAAWEDNEPGEFIDPKTVMDGIGITCYQGGSHTSDATYRAELVAQIDAHPGNVEAVYDWLTDRNLNRADIPWSVPWIEELNADWLIYAGAVSMDLIAYEGGSHEWSSFGISFGPGELAKLRDFFIGYVYTFQYAAVMDANRLAWEAVSDLPFMHLTDVAQPGDSGCWGAKRYLSDMSPRWAGLASIKYGLPYVEGYTGVRTKNAP